MTPATVTPIRADAVVREIALDAIRVDQRAQPRDHLSTEITNAYADDMRTGAAFPALVTFFDGEVYWLADGFHRHYAAQGAGLKTFRCEVRSGGLREAILHSCGANAEHGHRRSNEDKRRAVRRLLEDAEWRQWSDREVARRCSVDHKMVARVREEMQPTIHTGESASMPEAADTTQRTFVHHKTGKPSQMDTSTIGKNNGAASSRGPRIRTTDGESVSRAIRRGLEMESSGLAVVDAAKQIGLDITSYRAARDIVLLSDRADLSAADAIAAREALETLDQQRQARQAHQRVRHLIERIWGGKGFRRNAESESRRVEAFKDAVSVIVEACTHGADIDIPHLVAATATQAVKELRQAERALRALCSRIEETQQ